ncbi:MAG: hypothetical protein RLZZ171_1561, partial [Cyanobacteriota bacterium]
GLFLSLPLTVVAQIWFKEVIVKDVLDNWNYSFAGNQNLEKNLEKSEKKVAIRKAYSEEE